MEHEHNGFVSTCVDITSVKGQLISDPYTVIISTAVPHIFEFQKWLAVFIQKLPLYGISY